MNHPPAPTPPAPGGVASGGGDAARARAMDAQRAAELAARFGLRNADPSFLRQTSQFSLDNMASPLASRDLADVAPGGTLPFRVADAHAVPLGVPCLVQVEDVINIAADDPRRGAARAPGGGGGGGSGGGAAAGTMTTTAAAAASTTTLLLRLTDGRQFFGAIELRPFGGRLSVRTPPGAKLRLAAETVVRRGRVLLTPEHVEMVGWANAAGNVWGSEYDAKVADALRAAGLRPPGAISFDALAPSSSANAAQAQITGLGGIAELPPDENDRAATGDDDDNGDAFWLQAIAQESTARD